MGSYMGVLINRLVVTNGGEVQAVDVGLENFYDLYEDVAHTFCGADEDMLVIMQSFYADLDIR
eukprot:scaffold672662_cov48-Prasinocladus_malaysianus.AAC.1